MSELHIGIIRGGHHESFAGSLNTGASMLDALEHEKHVLHDILIDTSGTWHRRGIPQFPHEALRGIDVAILATHGPYAESGVLQKILERQGVRFTGSSADATEHARHKARARNHLKATQAQKLFKHPQFAVVENIPNPHFADAARTIFSHFGPPYILKPLHGGGSRHMRVAQTVHDLPHLLEEVMHESGDDVLVEQYIPGRHVSCYVIDGFRGEDRYAFPPIEAKLAEGQKCMSDEQKKEVHLHTDILQHVDLDVKKQLEYAAKEIHEKLNLKHYSKIDFILAPHGTYFLEANTHPNLGGGSALKKVAEYVGSSLKDIYHHLARVAYGN